jgi:hypothetical protein
VDVERSENGSGEEPVAVERFARGRAEGAYINQGAGSSQERPALSKQTARLERFAYDSEPQGALTKRTDQTKKLCIG